MQLLRIVLSSLPRFHETDHDQRYPSNEQYCCEWDVAKPQTTNVQDHFEEDQTNKENDHPNPDQVQSGAALSLVVRFVSP